LDCGAVVAVVVPDHPRLATCHHHSIKSVDADAFAVEHVRKCLSAMEL
jgi:hypothetical protein